MILQHSTVEFASHSAWALACMAGDADVRKRVCAGGGVPALVAGLTRFDVRGKQGAVTTLENLASMQEGAEQIVREPVRPCDDSPCCGACLCFGEQVSCDGVAYWRCLRHGALLSSPWCHSHAGNRHPPLAPR